MLSNVTLITEPIVNCGPVASVIRMLAVLATGKPDVRPETNFWINKRPFRWGVCCEESLWGWTTSFSKLLKRSLQLWSLTKFRLAKYHNKVNTEQIVTTAWKTHSLIDCHWITPSDSFMANQSDQGGYVFRRRRIGIFLIIRCCLYRIFNPVVSLHRTVRWIRLVRFPGYVNSQIIEDWFSWWSECICDDFWK